MIHKLSVIKISLPPFIMCFMNAIYESIIFFYELRVPFAARKPPPAAASDPSSQHTPGTPVPPLLITG